MTPTGHDEPRDGARRTRGQALRAALAGGAAIGTAAIAGAWTRPPQSAGRGSPARDVGIMNFLLTLEEAQAGFYDAALRGGALRGELLDYAKVVAPQEREHVALLRRRLGPRAEAPPRTRFGDLVTDPTRFQDAAIDLEEQVAGAYIGLGPNLTGGPMQDAARIVAVEARHAAWIRDIAGVDPAPRAADPAAKPRDVLAHLRTKGFLR
jgi:Ferritin-like domain